MFYLLVLHSIALLIVVTDQEPDAVIHAASVALFVVSTATALRACWFLERAGECPQPKLTVAAWLLIPPVVLWIVTIVDLRLAVVGAVPLWSAANLYAALSEPRRRWAVIAGAAGVCAAHPVVGAALTGVPIAGSFSGSSASWQLTVYAALLPLIVIGGIWWWRVVDRLDESRRLAGDLAVARERLRFAADLHDIQGHHLQVIALKAELAERVLRTDSDVARNNLMQVRELARTAMDETRSLVHGYRHVALHEELANAADVLAAAGIECDLRTSEIRLDETHRRLLGLVVREATTNILRHATAERADIGLREEAGHIVLEISNSGAGLQPTNPAGTGLRGLRDRLITAGGSVDVHVADGTFVLRAELPSHSVGVEA